MGRAALERLCALRLRSWIFQDNQSIRPSNDDNGELCQRQVATFTPICCCAACHRRRGARCLGQMNQPPFGISLYFFAMGKFWQRLKVPSEGHIVVNCGTSGRWRCHGAFAARREPSQHNCRNASRRNNATTYESVGISTTTCLPAGFPRRAAHGRLREYGDRHLYFGNSARTFVAWMFSANTLSAWRLTGKRCRCGGRANILSLLIMLPQHRGRSACCTRSHNFADCGNVCAINDKWTGDSWRIFGRSYSGRCSAQRKLRCCCAPAAISWVSMDVSAHRQRL